jgi:hypothetical protein
MPHHFTKSTVEASVWCNRCGRMTQWRIADGRRSYCLVCYEKGDAEAKARPAPEPAQQGSLFDD